MKTRGLRWWVVSLVALATVINYVDRNALAVMWPAISDEFGMDKFDYAFIVNCFMVGYAIGQTAFGKIFDAIGTRLGFVLAIVGWSVAVALHAAVRTAFQFSVVRFAMGVAEAGNWPGATKSNAEWFPIRERALAQGIFNSGASLGAVVSAPLVAFLYLWIGWKATFVLLGGLGFLWLVPWLIVFKSGPDSHPWLTAEEREHILTGQRVPREDGNEAEANTYAPGWFEMLKHRQSWSVIASRFFLDPVWWLFVSWLPLYLVDQFGFDIKQIGLFAWVPYVGAAMGALLGGWLARQLLQRGWSVDRTRKVTIWFGGLLMFPALLATTYAFTPLLAVLLIAVILFGFQIAIGSIQTLPSDFYSGDSVGSLAGVGGTAAVVGVLIMNSLIPWVTGPTTDPNWVPAFVIGALLVPLALLSVWLFARKVEPVTPK
ncbi:MAG: MFS transporter [Gammaproteobacteria bacterium]|nr:MFS transporter [Gammaproteobacteria bacterium]